MIVFSSAGEEFVRSLIRPYWFTTTAARRRGLARFITTAGSGGHQSLSPFAICRVLNGDYAQRLAA
jgi:hypothetical protein